MIARDRYRVALLLREGDLVITPDFAKYPREEMTFKSVRKILIKDQRKHWEGEVYHLTRSEGSP